MTPWEEYKLRMKAQKEESSTSSTSSGSTAQSGKSSGTGARTPWQDYKQRMEGRKKEADFFAAMERDREPVKLQKLSYPKPLSAPSGEGYFSYPGEQIRKDRAQLSELYRADNDRFLSGVKGTVAPYYIGAMEEHRASQNPYGGKGYPGLTAKPEPVTDLEAHIEPTEDYYAAAIEYAKNVHPYAERAGKTALAAQDYEESVVEVNEAWQSRLRTPEEVQKDLDALPDENFVGPTKQGLLEEELSTSLYLAYEDSYKSGNYDLVGLSKSVGSEAKRISELEQEIREDRYTLDNWAGDNWDWLTDEGRAEAKIISDRIAANEKELKPLQDAYTSESEAYSYYLGRIFQDMQTDSALKTTIATGKQKHEAALKSFDEYMKDPENQENLGTYHQQAPTVDEGRREYPLAVSIEDLSEEDRDKFWYLIGKGYDEIALDYANRVVYSDRKERLESIENWAGKNFGTGAVATAGSLLTLPVSWMDPMIAANKTANTGLQYSNVGPGSFRDSLKSGVAKSLNEFSGTIPENIPVIGGKGLGDLYQLGMSMAESYLSGVIAGPVGASAMLGGSAFASGYNQAMSKGVDHNTALKYGAAQGLAEVVFEYVSLDKLFSESGGSFLKNVLSQGGVEASEEACTSIANFFTDRWIMGGKSEYELSVKAYMDDGLTEEEARKKATWDFVENTAADALGGFISGGGMSAANSAVNKIMTSQQNQINRAHELLGKVDERTDAYTISRALHTVGVEFSEGEAAAMVEELEARGKSHEEAQTAVSILNKAVKGERLTSQQRKLLQGDKETAEILRAMVGQETASVESTAVDDNPTTHTAEEMQRIEEYKNAADSKLLAFVQKVRTLKNQKYRSKVSFDLGEVSERQARDVEALTGVNVTGYSNGITGGAVDHIDSRHGVKGEADRSMSDDADFSRLGYVLQNYDGVELVRDKQGALELSQEWQNKDQSHAQMVRFSKKVNGTYYVVEAVPDSSRKKLQVVSAYMQKKTDDLTQEKPVSQSSAETVGDGSPTRLLNIETRGNSPQLTPETPAGKATPVNPSVPQEGITVNSNYDGAAANLTGVDGKNAEIAGSLNIESNNPVGSKERVRTVLSEQEVPGMVAEAFVRDYDGSEELSEELYARGMAEAFYYGRMNVPREELSTGRGLSPLLSERQRNYAYEQGRLAREAELEQETAAIAKRKEAAGKATAVTGKGYVHLQGKLSTKKLTPIQDASVKALGRLAESLGRKFYLFESELGADGKPIGENGSYDPETGDIYLDINAGEFGQGAMLYAAAHELTHMIRQWSPSQFKVLADFLMEKYGEKGVSVSELVRRQQEKAQRNGRKLSFMGAYEEMVADSMETMLSDGAVLERIEELRGRDRGLVQKIRNWFKAFASKLRRIYKGMEPDTVEGRLVAEMVEEADRLHELFAQSLVDAAENFEAAGAQKNTTYEGGVMLSDREKAYFKKCETTIRDTVRKAIENKGDIGTERNQQQISPVYDVLAEMVSDAFDGELDISNKYIALNGSDVWHEYSRHTKSDVEQGRGQIAFTLRQFINAIKAVYSPDVIERLIPKQVSGTVRQSFAYAKRTVRGHYVVVEAVGGKKNPNIVPIEILQVSKDKWNKYMSEGKTLGEMLYENSPDKLAALDISANKKSRVTATQFASKKAIAHTSHSPQLNHSISDSGENVNRKYLEAVKAGDMETAQRMVDEAAKTAGYTSSDDWRMAHRAPTRTDDTAISMDQIDSAYGGDGSIYSFRAVQYYGEGRDYDRKAFNVIRSARSNPDKLITVYRAVPIDIQDSRVRNGDWIAITREYAEEHGERMFDDGYRILENKVPAKHIYGNGDSIHEWGYDNGDPKEVYKNAPGNVKLAAVTYDDNGNVIPLSERFNEKNSDIRYSDRGNLTTRSILTELDVSSVENALERKYLLQYQEDSENHLIQQRIMREAQARFDALSKEAKPDKKKMLAAKTEATQAKNRMNAYAWRLERAESGEQLRGLIRREVKAVLTNAVSKHGTIPAGERAATDRVVEMPKSIDGKNKVSRVARSAAEANMTPKEFVPLIEEAVVNGMLSYDSDTNKAQVDRAHKWLEHNGWKECLFEWLGNAKQQKRLTKDDVARGIVLYNNLANQANAAKTEEERIESGKDAIRVLTELQTMVTEQAQALQAMRIMKKQAPEMQYFALQKSVKKIEEEMTKKLKKKLPNGIQLNETLVAEWMDALRSGDESRIEAAEKTLYRDIAAQIPVTFREKWNSWRYLAMLLNPRTHIRNILGNAGFVPVRMLKDSLATGMEMIGSGLSGGRMHRTKAALNIVGKADRALLSAAWGDYKNVEELVQSGGKYNDNANDKIMKERRMFKMGWLEGLRKLNEAGLDGEDMWFSKPAYAAALAGYLKAHGITADQFQNGTVVQEQLDRARAYAILEAAKATYRDTNEFSAFVSKIGRHNTGNQILSTIDKVGGAMIEGVLPFKKTPANILVRGVGEYSPIGLLRGVKQLAWDVPHGNRTAAEGIDMLASGLTGTGLLALGIWACSIGLISGVEDDEEKREFEQLMGSQNYALNLGEGNYTIDWLAPEALPVFVGVEIAEAFRDRDGKINVKTVMDAISNISEPILEMSMLSSLNDLLDDISYSDNKLMSILSTAATNYLTQFVPSVFGSIERATEDRRYTTFADKDHAILQEDWQFLLANLGNKAPFEYKQIPFVDAWGREEDTGEVAFRMFSNFVSPGYYSETVKTPVDDELMRLYEAGQEGVFPDRVSHSYEISYNVGEERIKRYLTSEEYLAYAKTKGQTSLDTLCDICDSDWYADLDDETKADVIGYAYDYAKELGKSTAVPQYEVGGWEAEAIKGTTLGISPSVYIRAKVATGKLAGVKNSDGNTIPNSRGLLVMREVYKIGDLSKDQRQFLFAAFDVGGKVIDYSRKEVDRAIKEMGLDK